MHKKSLAASNYSVLHADSETELNALDEKGCNESEAQKASL